RDTLALPGIGGLFERLDSDGADRPDALDEPLEGLRLSNRDLLAAVRMLAEVRSDGPPRPVDFRHLGAEELGSVYEELLELHPEHDPVQQTFSLVAAAGNQRKETGSYYTPRALADALLDSALDPVLDEAASTPGDASVKIEALLRVTVCDPACGSGHFLVAAARRIARRVAQLRSGENEPSPDLVRAAMREVVSRCIHGVDINEMAAELAKVSLWLESVQPGRPLPFLDATIRVGNSLLGATPALIAGGVPKEAFAPLEGDDRKVAAAVAKLNTQTGAGGQLDLLAFGQIQLSNSRLADATRDLVTALRERLADIAVQRKRLREIDGGRLAAKHVADAWCATFVQDLTPATAVNPITEAALDWTGDGPATLAQSEVADRVQRITQDYRFFHWHVEFPHVFRVNGDADPATGWSGGFSCVVGNPPWERVKLQDQEFFAARHPDIAKARNKAARDKMINALDASDDPVDQALIAEYLQEIRRASGWSHFLRASKRYPLTGRGDINTYSVFAETGRTIIAPRGRVGLVLPTGIATDATTQYFFKDLVTTRTLASVYDFENEEHLFPAVDHRVRFALWTASGRAAPRDRIDLAFRLRQVPQIAERRFQLTPDDITG
ncbi:MAG: N-6 DNA methylase, partial [Actinomycetota bacterium]|nr:N-6 DNA methylase [Actinomycetota bacterium]